MKGIFSDFFMPENIESLADPCNNLINTVFTSENERLGINKDTWTKIDLKKFIEPGVHKIVDYFILGVLPEEPSPMIDGNPLSVYILKYIKTGVVLDVWGLSNSLCFGLLKKLGLGPYKDFFDMEKKICKKLLEIYYQRYDEISVSKSPDYTRAQSSKNRDINVIDLIAHYNKKSKECNTTNADAMTELDIVGNINLYVYAAVGTTLASSSNAIINMTYHCKEYLDKIKVHGVSTVDDIVKNEMLDLCLKEVFRLWNPSSVPFFPRKLVKDVKLGGISMRKGDSLMIMCG